MPTNRIADRSPRELPQAELNALARAELDLGSQVRVAEVLGVSATVVNQLLKGKYRGDVLGMAQRIRGALMHEVVTCPVLGQIDTKVCLDEQRRPLVFTNRLRVALHRACKTCPHRKDHSTTSPKGNTP